MRTLCTILLLTGITIAQPPPGNFIPPSYPQTISFQAMISDTLGNSFEDGIYNFSFRISRPAQGGAEVFWEESKQVDVVDGLINTVLGSENPIISLPFRDDLILTVALNNELIAVTSLTSVPFSLTSHLSLNAMHADTAYFTHHAMHADSSGFAHHTQHAEHADTAHFVMNAPMSDSSLYAHQAGHAMHSNEADSSDYSNEAGTADYATESDWRKTLKIFTGTQGVSNFRPTAAHAIYNRFLPDGGTTWDMSGGYGGRLLGAIKTHINYIATEPAKETFDGLTQIAKDWGQQSNLFGIEQSLEIVQSGSEDSVSYTHLTLPTNREV